MYLYELALELEEKSLDLAERASGLGLHGAGPSTELSKVQVAAIRGNVPIPEVGEDGQPLAQPLAWGEGGGPDGNGGKSSKKGKTGLPPPRPGTVVGDIEELRKHRKRHIPVDVAIIAVLLLGAVGLVSYMGKNIGSVAEKKQALALDNAKVEAETRSGALATSSALGGAKAGDSPAAFGVANVDQFCEAYAGTRDWTEDLTSYVKRRYAVPGSVNIAGWAKGNAGRLVNATTALQASTAGPLHSGVVALVAQMDKQSKTIAAIKTAAEEDRASLGWLQFTHDPKVLSTQRDLLVARQATCD